MFQRSQKPFSYFYDEVDDVLAAGEYLSKQPYVDANRVFVAGHSVGGTMALLAAMASKRFLAGASFEGVCYEPQFVTRGKAMPFDSTDPREIQLRLLPLSRSNITRAKPD
jgi:poly(3-hydroxybutyrate) depolymerase